MAADDLAVLAPDLRRTAHRDDNGEVSWHMRDVPLVLDGLAANGRVVLGLDIRKHDHEGTLSEVAWSAYDGTSADEAREIAKASLEADDIPGDWVVITWVS